MHRIARCLLALALFVFPLTALAQDAAEQASGASAALLPSARASLGVRSMYFDYSEPGLMDETGWLHGVYGDVTYHTKGQWMFRGELEFLGGVLDYDGQYQNGQKITRDTNDTLFNVRFLFGRDFELSKDLAVTPYTGMGFRAWNDEIEGTGGYEREIRQWHMPLGLALVKTYGGGWRTGLSAEYDLFLGGRVKSKLSQANPGYEDLSNTQNFANGYGLRLSLFAEKDFGGYSLGCEPFWRMWKIDRSDTSTVTFNNQAVAYGWEPKNETMITGLSLYFNF